MASEPTPERTSTHPPHPVAGWVAVIPLPASHQPGDEPSIDGMKMTEAGVFRVFEFSVRSPLVPQQGIAVALVMEIGPMPTHWDTDVAAPYFEGCTVYYPDSQGVQIGDFTYIRLDAVLAWEEPPK